MRSSSIQLPSAMLLHGWEGGPGCRGSWCPGWRRPGARAPRHRLARQLASPPPCGYFSGNIGLLKPSRMPTTSHLRLGSEGRRPDHSVQARASPPPVLRAMREIGFVARRTLGAHGGTVGYRRSMIIASGEPPASHITWRLESGIALPRELSNVVVRRAPEAPSGWPRAMAPAVDVHPLRDPTPELALPCARTTEAKASLTSNRSMSGAASCRRGQDLARSPG